MRIVEFGNVFANITDRYQFQSFDRCVNTIRIDKKIVGPSGGSLDKAGGDDSDENPFQFDN